MKLKGKAVYVHRYVWEKVNGPIPEGMEIDHRCRVRACCNVRHLRVVTPTVQVTENVVGSAWQLNAAKTHCPAGHEYTEENTYARPDRPGNRECRKCRRIARLAYAAKG